MEQSAPSLHLQPRSPLLVTRLIYALGAFSVIPVTFVGSSVWVELATGGMFAGQVGMTVCLLIGAAILFRIYQVLRYPRALETWPSGWVAKGFRGLGFAAMLVGGLTSIGLLFIRPITYALMKNPGDSGIGFFVVGLYLVVIASVGWKGCIVYEIARLAGRPPNAARAPSSFRWKQDAIVAVLLVAVCLGGPAFRKLNAPPRCEGIRIACVSKTQAEIKSMVALPFGTPVHFESSVKEIDLAHHSGNRANWVLSENPAVSLKASGYPPTTDANTTVQVKIDAADSQDGVVMHLLVSEGSQQTARFTTTFARGSKLERDAGAVRIAIEAPSNIDTLIHGMQENEQGRPYTLDQIYVLLRQAIGTEQEVRESALRLSRSARITSEIEGDAGGSAAKARWNLGPLDARCADLVTVSRAGPPQSASPDDLGWPMRQLLFSRATDASLHTNIHGRDRILCEGGNIFILSYSTANPLFSMRRYSEEGKLLRYLESPLPAPKEGYDFIDVATLRESANALTFDRIGAQFKGGKEYFVRRQSFEIPLQVAPPR